MGMTASILAGGASTAGSFASQQFQARGIQRQADFDSSVAGMQAQDVVARGAFQASQRESAGRRIVGAERAGAAAGGVDPNTGSSLDLQSDEAKFSELDAMTIRNNAAREAWGYLAQAQIGQSSARNEAENLRLQSGMTLLTGAAKTYGIYSQNRNTIPAPVSPKKLIPQTNKPGME